jgi:tetratricopeptide (TPR) repeat protein
VSDQPQSYAQRALETRLEAIVARDPGADAFPALAESHRRSGRPDEAERVAREGLRCRPDRIEARTVLCLALLDQGRNDDAHRELERAADDLLAAGVLESDYSGEISEGELESAFDRAEADVEEVVDADRVAQEAIEEADLGLPEGFKTSTMADLLEAQGDLGGATRIRSALQLADDEEHVGEGLFPLDGPVDRQKTLKTLERWLGNVREH